MCASHFKRSTRSIFYLPDSLGLRETQGAARNGPARVARHAETDIAGGSSGIGVALGDEQLQLFWAYSDLGNGYVMFFERSQFLWNFNGNERTTILGGTRRTRHPLFVVSGGVPEGAHHPAAAERRRIPFRRVGARGSVCAFLWGPLFFKGNPQQSRRKKKALPKVFYKKNMAALLQCTFFPQARYGTFAELGGKSAELSGTSAELSGTSAELSGTSAELAIIALCGGVVF